MRKCHCPLEKKRRRRGRLAFSALFGSTPVSWTRLSNFDAFVVFLKNGSMTRRLASLHWLQQGTVRQLQRYYQDAMTSCRPSGRALFLLVLVRHESHAPRKVLVSDKPPMRDSVTGLVDCGYQIHSVTLCPHSRSRQGALGRGPLAISPCRPDSGILPRRGHIILSLQNARGIGIHHALDSIKALTARMHNQ